MKEGFDKLVYCVCDDPDYGQIIASYSGSSSRAGAWEAFLKYATQKTRAEWFQLGYRVRKFKMIIQYLDD